MKPALPLHRWPKGRYVAQNAASHSTSEAFAARQRERMKTAQATTMVVVTPIETKRKGKAA